MARGDNPAAATSYNPTNAVSVSDPTPGANADLHISFSLNAPDSFPNLTSSPTIQFLPRQWGVAADAPLGAIAGQFNALSTLGIVGNFPCIFAIAFSPTMYVASVDTSDPTSALDLAGNPGGLGYSGQFTTDPDTIETPADLGLPLISFNADEKWAWSFAENVGNYPVTYRDVDGNNVVSAGDIRFNRFLWSLPAADYPPGTIVQPGDVDVGYALSTFPANQKHANADGNGQMDVGEGPYRDVDGSADVSYGDVRLFEFGALAPKSVVAELGVPGGITRYPDFMNQLFPADVIGPPLVRLWGGQNVILSAVSLNIVTFRPGQLPGYPASLGYPSAVVVLNPAATLDPISMSITTDLCTPLSLTNTNFGVSRDNAATQADEGGIPLLTNPKSEKDHVFTLVTQSDYDADDDGIENWLDTCALTPNTQDLDGRNLGNFYGPPEDPDGDGLDGACDPDPINAGAYSPGMYVPDEDLDNYPNRGDLCPLNPDGVDLDPSTIVLLELGAFTFPYADFGDFIGPGIQTDTDGDRIGDACDPNPTVPDGHMHVVTLTQGVPIFKHGVKLNQLGGPKNVNNGGARTYSVDVSNLGSSAEDVQVALRVVEGCAAVSGPSSVSVAADGSASASFTVDWTGCAAGTYTVQADACHAGDAAPAGLFGSGVCPGASDGMTDPNTLDDAPIAKSVEVGSP